MFIKNATLSLPIQQSFQPIYCLIGPDPFQINTFAKTIMNAWKNNQNDCEFIVFDLTTAEDWENLQQEANHYSLFANRRILDARFDKKSLDTKAKQILEAYIKTPPKDCLFILRAPNLPLKAVQDYAKSNDFHLIMAQPPSPMVIKKWIEDRLRKVQFGYEEGIAPLIYQYNEGNLLAIAQFIEKLKIIAPANMHLETSFVEEELSDQSDFVLFDLPKTCFDNNPKKALQMLKQAKNQKQEPTLVLWVLTQALRVLIHMQDLIQKKEPIAAATKQYKLWSNQIPIYQKALARYDHPLLLELFQRCVNLDKQLKTSTMDIYQSLERISLSLCRGQIL